MAKKFGFSFSWKRAVGITALKQKVARATGIPTTKSGRERKIGRLVSRTGLGALFLLLLPGRRRRGNNQPVAKEQEATLGQSLIGCLLILLCLPMFCCVGPAMLFSIVDLESIPMDATHQGETAPTKASAVDATTPERLTPETNVTAPVEAVEPPQQPMKFWASKDGQFTTEADLIEFRDGKAHLKKRDGTIVAVPMLQLSKVDQSWVRDELKRRRETQK